MSLKYFHIPKFEENSQDSVGTLGREKFFLLTKRLAEPRIESQLSKENEQKQKQLVWPDIMTQWQAAGAIPSPPKLGERSKLKDRRNLHRVTGENSESIYSSDQLFGEVNRHSVSDQGLTRLVVRLWEEDNNNNNSQNLGMGGAHKVINDLIIGCVFMVRK